MGNFQTIQNTSSVPQRESSLGRRGPAPSMATGGPYNRAKNNSTTGMASSSNNGLNVAHSGQNFMSVQHTPQGQLHGY